MTSQAAAVAVDRSIAGAGRIAAVREKVAEAGLDALVVLGDGRHHFIAENLCWWLSGVRQLSRDAAVVLPRDGEAVLVGGPVWDAERLTARGWVGQVRATDDIAATLAAVLDELGGQRLGVAGAAAGSADVGASLATRSTVMDADDLVHAVSSPHDALALQQIGAAVRIAEAGYAHLLEAAAPGMPEHLLALEADAHMRELGADDDFLLISASQHNRAVHAPTDRLLGVGDVVLGEISPSVDGQFAQICRSAVLGEPRPELVRAYGLLCDAYAAGLEAIRPGAAVADVARAVDAVLIRAGYEDFCRPPYMRTRGHGTGLGTLAPADVSERSDVVLEEGMAFVLHPNQYFPDVGYLLCGDEVVVEADGARPLSTRPPALDVVAVEAGS